ncbi:MAG: DUF1566 domain-containing protein [Thermoanaerobaculia bacterium]
MRRLVHPVFLFAILSLVFSAAAAAAGPLRANGDGTVTDLGTGLTWVRDRSFAVSSGFAHGAVLPRAQAVQLVAAMNAGSIENFGRTGWRLPTQRELARISALTGAPLRPFRGGRLAAPRAAGDAVVAWPVFGASVLAGFDEVAILATNSIHIHRQSQVVGDVIANDASPGPTLRAGFELAIDRASTVDGDVKGDSVSLSRDVEVTGGVHYNSLDNDAVRVGSLNTPLDLPVFALLPPFQTAFLRPGAADVSVAAGQTLTLAAGDYDDIQIAAGGTLVLSGGVYNARSLTAIDDGALSFAAATDLRIAERLALGTAGAAVAADNSGVSGSEVIIYVGGIDGTDGLLGSLPRAVSIGKGTDLAANIYAPNGTIDFERDVTASGALIARDVLLNQNASLTLDSFFANRAPVAHPQDVFTNGDTDLVITLMGSDADNDDLRFAIVTDPTEGSFGDPPVVDEQPTPGPGDPRRTTATVTYDPDIAGNVEDSFVFKVTDPLGATGMATVRINPPDAPENPPPPATTVVAFDGAEQTTTGRPVTITLHGDAPADVALSFAIVAGSGPANGTLDPLTPGSESPQRTASTVYTPATGFNGTDGFDFTACGEILGLTVCDTAHVTITVAPAPVEPTELAPDQTATTPQDRAVQITLGGLSSSPGSSTLASAPQRLTFKALPAAFLDGAEIAGNVADANGDGSGDNHNVLPGSSPVFVSAGIGQSGGAGSNGTVRIHIEWDISSLGTGLDSADVLLHTHRGTVDSLNTFFFAGAGGNGSLEDSDFQTVLEQVQGVTMPVPPLEDMPVGSDGTFSFDIKDQLLAAITAGATHFTVQGRVNETAVGVTARGLEVRSTASSNLASFLEPQLSITTPGVVAPPTFTILSLPDNGVLRNSLGATIAEVPATLPDALVSYTPNASFIGNNSFSYQAELGENVDTGLVTIVVILGDCAIDPSFCDDGR